jgi:hypothetical protein
MRPPLDRRSFLVGGVGAAAFAVCGSSRVGGRLDRAKLAVAFDAPGRSIEPGFLGLSYETNELLTGLTLVPENRSLVALLRRLGGNGVIRIGGNSSDRLAERGGKLVMPQASLDRLAAFLQAVGWKLIYGLNLGSGTPEAAALEAEAVAHAVGPALIAFQIGNEPDLSHAELRPASYDLDAYLAEWRRFFRTIRERVPQAPFAGPDLNRETTWLAPFAREVGRELVLLTHHYYSDGPASSPAVNIPRMLDSAARLARVLKNATPVAQAAGLPLRMAEVNSVWGGGKVGVSDTLAAALWGVELMFEMAEAGWAGLNFHGGAGKAYSPIIAEPDGTFAARPIYYAMLLFARAARGTLLPAQLSGVGPTLRAYAIRGLDGRPRILLVNKDLEREVEVTMVATPSAARVLRLIAPAVESRADVTLGGATIGTDGTWSPAVIEPVKPSTMGSTVELRAASAALIEFD